MRDEMRHLKNWTLSKTLVWKRVITFEVLEISHAIPIPCFSHATRYPHWAHKLIFGRLVFETGQKDSKHGQNHHNLHSSEGHNLMCKKIMGVAASGKKLSQSALINGAKIFTCKNAHKFMWKAMGIVASGVKLSQSALVNEAKISDLRFGRLGYEKTKKKIGKTFTTQTFSKPVDKVVEVKETRRWCRHTRM